MCAPVVISDLDSLDRRARPRRWSSTGAGDRVYVGHGGSMPGYLAGLAVHRPSRTAVVGFANSYGLRGGTTSAGSARQLLDPVLDAEPAAADRRGGRPPPPPADARPS